MKKMILGFYILSIIYTNSMGLIAILICNPIIKRECELRGYRFKEKNDIDYVVDCLVSTSKFLIPGYYLNKAIKLAKNELNIDYIIKEKLDNKELEESDIFDKASTDYEVSTKRSKISETMLEDSPYIKGFYEIERINQNKNFDYEFWEESEIKVTEFIESDKENTESFVLPCQSNYSLDEIYDDDTTSKSLEKKLLNNYKKYSK